MAGTLVPTYKVRIKMTAIEGFALLVYEYYVAQIGS
jgi:hypothetical protein